MAQEAGGARVRLMRRASGLTQAELAQRVGVSRQTIISVERGDYAPSVYLALRIARELKSSVEQLFAAEEESEGTKS